MSNTIKLNNKIKEHALEALSLTKSDKEKLMSDSKIITGKVYNEDNREINKKLSKLAMEIQLERSVGIKK